MTSNSALPPTPFPPLPSGAASRASRPLRICIASFDFVGPVRNGGVGTAFTSLGEALAAAGHEVTLLYVSGHWCENCTMDHWISTYRTKGIRFVPMPGCGLKIDAPWHVLKSYEAYLWLKAERFDVVHFSEWKGPGYFTLLAKHQGLAFANTLLCVHTHGPTLWHKLSNSEYVTGVDDLEIDYLERRSVSLADVAVSPSQYLFGWMEQQGWHLPGNCFVQQYVRPATARKPLPSRGDRRSEINELVFFGRLEVRKGLVLFCEALDQLKREANLKRARVTFLGKVDKVEGRDAAEYVRDRAKDWPWQIAFITDRDQAGAMNYLQGGPRLAVIPSLVDNLPNTVLECLGAAVPFVASNAGGIPEMIAAADLEATCFPLRPAALADKLRNALLQGWRPAKSAVDAGENERAWVAWHESQPTATANGAMDSLAAELGLPPLVSICLSHWNRPAYLKQAMASIEAQDYQNFEVVLVDDGSTQPEAIALIDSLAPQFQARGWQLLRNAENRYPGAARNRAAQAARGEYLVFLDDDNCAKPQEVSTFVKVARKTGADILTCFLDTFSGATAPTESRKPDARWVFLGDAVAAGAIRNWFGDTNSLVRREVFLAVGGFHEQWGVGHEDWEFFAAAALQGYHLEVLPEPLAWYRLNDAEHTVNRKTPRHANHLRNIRPYLDAVPAALRNLILYAQGQVLRRAESANDDGQLSAYAQHTVNWRSKFEAGRALAGLKQDQAAVQMMLDAIKTVESSRHPRVILEALLETGQALKGLDTERARQLLQMALQLAANLHHAEAETSARELLVSLTVDTPELVAAVAPARTVDARRRDQPCEAPAPARVSIIIPTFNNLALTRQCFEALRRNTPAESYELVVVDNGSTDGTVEFLQAEQGAGRLRALLNQENLGFARGCNQGAQAAQAEWLLFLNNDTMPQPGWLEAMTRATGRAPAGIVGARLLYPDGRIQHAGIEFIGGVPDHAHRFAAANAPEVNQFRELDMITGACLLIARSLFVELGGFDEVYRNGVEDVDLCLRVRAAGHKVVYEPKAVVYHHEGQSQGRFDQVNENLKLFFARWRGRFDGQHRLIVARPPRIQPAQKSILLSAPACQVAWEGSFLDLGSLSHVNRELTRQLAKQPELHLARVAKNTLPAHLAKMPEMLAMARQLQATSPAHTAVTVRHQWPPNWNPPKQGKWVLIQPWEFGSLPADWVRHLRGVDEVWAPTEYVRRVYVESGVEEEKVKIVPNGIDPERFHPQAPPMKLATCKKFKFLFVGGTIPRKGPDLLLQCYLENFTASDDVCLVIKDFGGQSVYAGLSFGDQIRAAQKQPGGPEILYLTEELSPEELPGLYTACDCFVLPYRGEGFGLPVLEAMACGLAVIVTSGGATDDFAKEEWSYRVPATRREIGDEVDGLKLARPGWLLEPDAKKLSAQMRLVARKPEEARSKGRAASEYARREWTWERAAQIAAVRLQSLAARRPAKAECPRPAAKKSELPAVANIGQLNEARDLFRQKKIVPAWEAAGSALQARPYHPEALLLLAEIAQAAGDTAQARRLADRARQLAPNWKAAKRFQKSPPSKAAAPAQLPPLPEAVGRAPQTPRLTVCLITKNEERFIEQCLKSIRALAWQIIVTDTGSTDRTKDIARQHGAEVYSFEWVDDFSAARNAALEQARGDWVLILDADEELAEADSLQQELQSASTMAWRLPIVDAGKEAEGCHYGPRLFRNAPGLFFTGRIHEQVFPRIEECRKEWGLENRLGATTLRHHGYTAEVARDRDKIGRNLRLLEVAVEELPDDPNLWMNFGLELVRDGRVEPGLEQYRKAFELMSAQPAPVPELREVLLTQFGAHLLAAKRHEEMVELFSSPLARSGGLTASMHFALGLAFMELKRFEEAAQQMRHCLAKRNQRVLSPVNQDICKSGPHHCLTLCLDRLNKPAEAEKAFRAALAEEPERRPLRLDFARFLAQQTEPVEALKLLHQLVSEKADDPAVWLLGGEIALRQSGLFEFAADWTGEAVKFLPKEPAVQLQRAQALLVNRQFKAALEIVREWHAPDNASHRALLAVCEILSGGECDPLPGALEPVASQDFLQWYRGLLGAGADDLIKELNAKLGDLARVLPSAAPVLEAALLEASQA